MDRKRPTILVVILLFLLASCNLGSQNPVFPPTLSPAPPIFITPAGTAVAATTKPPGATPLPNPTQPGLATATENLPNPAGTETRIDFAPGATSAEVSGELRQGTQLHFLVSANKGQWMMVELGSRNSDIYLSLAGADGTSLVPGSSRQTSWQGMLPVTEDYRISLYAGGGDSSYDLSITIPAIIQFSPGATSAAVQGQVTARANSYYMLYALAGQKMDVAVKSTGNDVQLTMYGLSDGQPLVRASASGSTQWSGILRATQYYMIIAVTSGKDSPFLIQISIQ